MKNSDLSSLRNRLQGCELVALVDISTGTTLASASIIETPQEDIDLLAEKAVALLNLPDAPPQEFCLLSDSRGTCAFVRVPGDQSEAVCMVLDPKADLKDVKTQSTCFLLQEARE